MSGEFVVLDIESCHDFCCYFDCLCTNLCLLCGSLKKRLLFLLYWNVFFLLLISLLCNSQRLLGDPVTKQICVFPRRGNDPRTTVGIRTCLWSCSLQYKSTYLNIMSFCAVDCVYFVFLFVSLKIRKWSHCHLCFTCPWSSFIGSYFVHLNVLCSFTSVFMFSLYLYFVEEDCFGCSGSSLTAHGYI